MFAFTFQGDLEAYSIIFRKSEFIVCVMYVTITNDISAGLRTIDNNNNHGDYRYYRNLLLIRSFTIIYFHPLYSSVKNT